MYSLTYAYLSSQKKRGCPNMILIVRIQNSRKESLESNIPNPTIFTPLHLCPSRMFKRVSLLETSGGNSTGIPFQKKKKSRSIYSIKLLKKNDQYKLGAMYDSMSSDLY